jgi:hypothetical protein
MDPSFPPGSNIDQPICAIDFDGVLHDDHLGFHDGTCYGAVISGSADALRSISDTFKIVVFTAKAKKDRPLVGGKTGTELVWRWLEEKGLSHFVSEVTAEKPRAFIYIDDRGFRFTDWRSAMTFLRDLETM